MLKTFLDYVRLETTSDESSETTPSTASQFALAHRVAEDLRACGIVRVVETPECYVYATIPASPGQTQVPPLGFIAHLDTSPEVSGKNVHPRIVEAYDGKPLVLGSSNIVLDPSLCPELAGMIGKTLVTTDGTTLLGGDDKAGVAILVQLARTLAAPDAPSHPELHLAFTPDEEIGRGTVAFDPDLFAAKYAYTVDGSAPDIFECANFNAAAATFSFTGVNTHPGAAKNIMRNAIKMANRVLDFLPVDEAPESTEGREGFFHPLAISGSVAKASLSIIVRDHDAKAFDARKAFLSTLASRLNKEFGDGSVQLELHDQYRNMEEALQAAPFLKEAALSAIRSVGLQPVVKPIRGGTDGAILSQRGIPCPNLGNGGHLFHSLCEFVCLQEMEQALSIVLQIAQNWHCRFSQ